MAGFLGDWDFIWRLRVGCWNWLIQIWWKQRGILLCVGIYLPLLNLGSTQHRLTFLQAWKCVFELVVGNQLCRFGWSSWKLGILQGQPPVLRLRSGTAKSNGDVLFLACFTTGKWLLPTLSWARGGGSWELQPWGQLLSVSIRVTSLPRTPFLSFPSWPPSLGPIIPSIHCAY